MDERVEIEEEDKQPPLIVIVGPTAVGKTALSIALCHRFGGEVISADSRQIYRGMDIGTAKPSLAVQQQIPHHLFDIRNPDEPLSLSQFQKLAYRTIDEVHARKRLPFLVGGSALYVRAIVEGLRIPEVPPDPRLRAELEAIAEQDGWQVLFAKLEEIDPATAAQSDPKNVRRVVRALEIVLTTGRSKVELEGSDPPPYRLLEIGLDLPRELLYKRIDQRVDQMMAGGLADECRRLLAAGYADNLPAMTSLGYREMGAYFRGELSYEEAVEKIKTETHRFVRHQYTWFRKMHSVQWFNMSQSSVDDLYIVVEDFLASGLPAHKN